MSLAPENVPVTVSVPVVVEPHAFALHDAAAVPLAENVADDVTSPRALPKTSNAVSV